MLIVGLDLSYTRTGVASISRDVTGTAVLDTVTFGRCSTDTCDSVLERTSKLKSWVSSYIIAASCYVCGNQDLSRNIDLVVIEGIGFGGKMSAMTGGLNTAICSMIYDDLPNTRILIVPPMTLKRYHGVKKGKKGITEKAKSFPLVDSFNICHDEADAFFLALLGADLMSFEYSRSFVSELPSRRILFDDTLTKKGLPKGLALRPIDFLFECRSRENISLSKIEGVINGK